MNHHLVGSDKPVLSAPFKSRISRAVTFALMAASATFANVTHAASEIKIDDTVRTVTKPGAANIGVSHPTEFNQDLSKMSAPDKWLPGDAVKVANPRHIRDIQDLLSPVNTSVQTQDPLLVKQLKSNKLRSATAAVDMGINIDGLGFTGVNPPDTTGDIGLKYFIQSINGSEGSIFAIYDKTTGEQVAGPLKMADLATGDCTNTMGDPIILFDEQAKRWMITEFTNESTKKMCVLISKTEDPVAGGWYGYDFQAPEFPDYPKFGRMGDAYYISANESGGSVFAIERSQMLQGLPARMQRQTIPSLAGFGFQSITPVDVDGELEPESNTPGYFIRHRDDELHNTGANDPEKDFLELWTYAVDFDNEDNSKVVGPINIPVTDFDSNFDCPQGFGCLTQKDSDTVLDPLKEVVMYKAQYRKFDGHESIVGNYVTKTEGNVATLRWFELRRIGDGEYSLHDEGSYNVADGSSRYMAASAMDSAGNIAIGYMVAGPDRYPSLAFTGRLAEDPAGTMSFGENVLVEGTGALSTVRDGDYAQMGVDPIDNCTFWFTGEYSGEDGVWGTRISSFKVPSCGDPNPGFTLSTGNTSQQICKNGNLAPITVSITGYNDFDKPVALSLSDLPNHFSGDFSVNPLGSGAQSELSMTIGEGATAGNYQFVINAKGDDATDKSSTANVKIVGDTSTAGLTYPENEAFGVKVLPTFTWVNDGQAQSFIIEVATDNEFSNVVAMANISGGDKYRPSEKLAEETQYFWRIKAANICGETMTEVKSFTTGIDIGNGTPDDPYILKENVPFTDINVGNDERVYFVTQFDDAPAALTFKLTADNGDGDLYASFDAIPQSRDDLVCASEGEETSDEVCLVEAPEAGKYYVMVSGYTAFTGGTLLAETPPPVPAQITGQSELAVDEDSLIALSPASLQIVDPDSSADNFVLQTSEGENYTLFGNIVQPASNFFGELSVPVKIFDGKVDSESFMLKITVDPVNDAPQATSDVAIVKQDSTNNMIAVLENDSDIDTDDELTIKSIAYSGAGAVEITENQVSYTPKTGFAGVETFNYTVSDSAGAEVQATVSVAVEAKPTVETVTVVKKEKSSGSIPLGLMVLLTTIMLLRRNKKRA